MPFPLAAVAGGGAQLLSTVAQIIGNHFAQKAQNDYNSPVEQRKRLESAGLNPALMYGSATTSVGNQSTPVDYSSPISQVGNTVSDAIGVIGQLQEQSIARKVIENATKETDASVALKTANANYKKYQLANDVFLHNLTRGTSYSPSSGNINPSDVQSFENWSKKFLNSTMADLDYSVNRNLMAEAEASLSRSTVQSRREKIDHINALLKRDVELGEMGLTRNSPVMDKLILSILRDNLGFKLGQQGSLDGKSIWRAIKNFIF